MRQFSWIDQRLVREHHLERVSWEALALYLLLVTVADAQGLSYYSDHTVCRLLSLSGRAVDDARSGLMSAGLIAYRAPLYQVLALEYDPISTPSPSAPPRGVPEPSRAALARWQQKRDPTERG